jgi:hypothetical protein
LGGGKPIQQITTKPPTSYRPNDTEPQPVETHPDPGPTSSFSDLIRRLRSGDPGLRDEAARRMWERYFPRLLKLARSRLHWRIRVH